MNLINSWRNYFPSFDKKDQFNRAMDSMETFLPQELDTKGCLDRIASHSDLPLLILLPNKKMKILFKHKIFQDLAPDAPRTFVCLADTGRSTTPYEVNPDSLFNLHEDNIQIPLIDELRNAQDAAAVMAVDAPDNGVRTIQPRHAIIVPPFVAACIMGLDYLSPAAVLPRVNAAIQAFDSTNEGDESMPKANIKCKYILTFIWAAAKDHIQSVSISPSDAPDHVQYAQELDCKFLGPTGNESNAGNDGGDDINSKMVRLMERQTDVLESQRDLQKSSDEQKTNKFSKLPDHIQQAYLFGQVEEDSGVPTEPTEHMSKLLSQSSVSSARATLNNILNNRLGCNIIVPGYVASALYFGNILREDSEMPGGFSFFFLQEAKTGEERTISSKSLEQHLRTTEGQGLTEKDFKELSSLKLTAVKDYDDLASRLLHGAATLKFMYGGSSPAYKFAEDTLQQVEDNKNTYKHRIASDTAFATKFLYLVDNAVYRFVHSCSIAEDRDSVNERSLAFDHVFEAVLSSTFHCILPPLLANLVAKADDDDTTSSRKRKAGNQGDDDSNKRVVNSFNRPKEWKVDSKDYAKVFSAPFNDIPSNDDGVQYCCRFTSRGYCKKGCPLCHDEIKGNKKKEYTEAVKARKEKAGL